MPPSISIFHAHHIMFEIFTFSAINASCFHLMTLIMKDFFRPAHGECYTTIMLTMGIRVKDVEDFGLFFLIEKLYKNNFHKNITKLNINKMI